ncbi:MAG: preprotein translocase subunit SecA [Candidatus Eisenbacteria bacterium]|nr:preprotein translocase subunit SecA [Candidatus Eisenbacteria bacterium]
MLNIFKGAASKVATKIFGTKSDRDVKRLSPLVDEINTHFEALAELSDEQLQAKTQEFRARLATEKEALDDLLPEAFAVVKEACRRHCGHSWPVRGHQLEWNMVPFDVQLMGGAALHQGKISEMATGEGKTLVAILPLYLNGLEGKGAHLVTVNDYLAARDSEWVGYILRWLGLSVACIEHDMDNEARRQAYLADVTYGTNNEFGFDYLRDNMVVRFEDRVQRPHHFAIVDEVDSVLVDEARTPLIISGPVQHGNQHYERLRPSVEELIRQQNVLITRFLDEAEAKLESKDKDEAYHAAYRLLQVQRGAPRNKRFMKIVSEGDAKRRIHDVESDYMREKRLHEVDDDLLYSIDERGHTVSLSEEGRRVLSPKDPKMFTLPDLAEEIGRVDKNVDLAREQRVLEKEEVYRNYAERSELLGNVNQLLRAYALYEKDKEYVVQEGKVLIVDEFTGRLMPGRRFSDGLHQALEAKERVRVGEENQTLATITIQNYFRLYEKLAGMTGTAETEAAEFWEIYKLDVVVIPTNEPIRRMDYEDLIYRTRKEKYEAILNEVEEAHKQGRPTLVGTVSVEVSETLSRMLKRRGIEHHVLNAKYHQSEAEIVAQAGRPGAVTIATNMAGRGTDIKLGPGIVKGKRCLVNSPSGVGDCSATPGVKQCMAEMPCGLHIIGTERHEARRIDRQLRGRAGRQGDPGSSRFYLSLEDDLMRLFGSDRISGMMEKLGVEEGEVITHPWVTSAIGRAQKRVELHNFSIRKHLLDYDNVMNQQREVIYSQRDEILRHDDISERIQELIESQVHRVIDPYEDPKSRDDDWEKLLVDEMQALVLAPVDLPPVEQRQGWEQIREICLTAAREAYQMKEEIFGPNRMREIERRVALAVIDDKWRDHLHEIDQLRGGISLRAYGQKDPLLEYKSEAFRMFEELQVEIEQETVRFLYRVVPAEASEPEAPVASRAPRPGAPRLDRPAPTGPAIYDGTTFETVWEAAGDVSARFAPGEPPPAPARDVQPANLPGNAPPRRMTESHGELRAFQGGVEMVAPALSPRPDLAPPSAPAPALRPAPRPAPGPAGGSSHALPKVGRNDPCPCGSGKKYKKCHGQNA